jgi:Cof subfamily protein (haloacid dehalogenase superfamily)
MTKGILFFDYDGTLVDEDAGIMKPTENTLQAIQQAKENGYLVILSTGRTQAYLEKMAEIPFDGYITTNGAYGIVGEQVLFNEVIPQDRIHRFMEYCEEHQIDYLLETQDRSFYSEEVKSEYFWERLLFFDFNEKNFFDFQKDSIPELAVNKMFVMAAEHSELEILKQAFIDELEIIPLPWGCFADVNNIGMSKGYGVTKFYEALHISRENTYAFGDGNNDYTMLQSVGHGVAMKRHQPSLDEVAEYVTGSVEEDGVVQAMKHYGIIG